MKQTIIILIFILFLPLVFSMYGGETWSYHFDKCDNLMVNITGTEEIIDGEYTILNNCTKNQTNHYMCDCNDNYYFNVTFKVNAVNNYTFDFNYDYSKYVQEHTSGGGGSSSSGTTKQIYDWNCTGWTSCQSNNKATRNCTNPNNDSDEKPPETRGCYFYTNIDKPLEVVLEKPVSDPQIEPVNVTDVVPQVEEPIIENKKPNYMLIFSIMILSFLIIIFVVAMILIKTQT